MLTIGWMANEGNVRRKGMDAAVRVLAAYRTLNPSARLIIAGTEGSGTKLLKEIALAWGVSDAVEFRFKVDEQEKIRLLQTAGFYMQLSEFEGFGLAALEALSCGACVVHSGRGGMVDFMRSHGVQVSYPINPNFVAQIMLETQAKESGTESFASERHVHVQANFSLKLRRDSLNAALGG
jgi:glycosyltransferase involved in cell wall biosynthesis